MGASLVWMVVTVLVLVSWSCDGCWEEERIGLMQFRASFNHPNGDSLPSWLDDKDTDCCKWEGVECDSATRRVIKLDLYYARDFLLQDWYLNASLFLPFEELKSINLTSNKIVGCLKNHGFGSVSSILKNLEVLNFGANYFNNTMLWCFSGLSSLKSLDLSENGLTGSFHIDGSLSHLEELDLMGNHLQSFMAPQGFEDEPSGLGNLKFLDLSVNNFNDSMFCLPSLKSLKVLRLSAANYNHLASGDYDSNMSTSCLKGLSALSSLEVLDLSDNNLNDSMLSHLSGISSLKSLNLAWNQLTGSSYLRGSLSHLEELDLSRNYLQSFMAPQGFEDEPSGLGNLKFLDLSVNNFNESMFCIPPLKSLKVLRLMAANYHYLHPLDPRAPGDIYSNISTACLNGLSSLSSLEVLDLSLNGLNDTMLSHLSGISSLKSLNLADNQLTYLRELSNLTKLETLILDHSSLSINALQSIGPLTSLKILSTSQSSLSGTLPTQGWCELNNLQELYLQGNELEGLLPPCLGNLTSLKILDVSDNLLSGNIAQSPLANLKLLKFLELSSNRFQVPISFKSFMNHSSLIFISCDNNQVIPDPTFQNFIPKLQLKYFSLSNCNSTTFPRFLYTQHGLRILDLSHNMLSGMFPSWLLENNTGLMQLLISENSFTGPLQFPYYLNSDLLVMDISGNNIHDHIPIQICSTFPHLENLRMANNAHTGNIPPCFGNMSSLAYLDLSNNLFSGVIPDQLIMPGRSLWFLKISNSNVEGQLSPSIFNSTALEYLFLDNNNLIGNISDIPSVKSSIRVLDISNNHFSGMLPRWIGNISGLQAVDFSSNDFRGSITTEFCKLDHLEYFDLSENHLSGSIPSCFNPSKISHVHLYKNQLTGSLTYAFHNSSSLVTLDLIENRLTGPLPNWIGRLSRLSFLLLKANNFDGEISVQLCLLRKLSILDLSQNLFSGRLPSCLGNLTPEENLYKISVLSSSRVARAADVSFLTSIGGATLREIVYNYEYGREFRSVYLEEVVEFTTKRMSYAYKGDVLKFMEGIDLSCNRFTGEIPPEIGQLREIRALNFSHNFLTGSIPTTFSKLKNIESLDLSHNNLSGGIPRQVTELNSLAVFNVAYNNLSGKTPDRIAQFGTFDEGSYEGNPLLCGPPLQNNCSVAESDSPVAEDETKDGFVDMDVFYASFGVSYTIVVLALAVILCINPYWRRAWFCFTEVCISTCYYFVQDNFDRLSTIIG